MERLFPPGPHSQTPVAPQLLQVPRTAEQLERDAEVDRVYEEIKQMRAQGFTGAQIFGEVASGLRGIR
jgi:hypothetical protein